MFASCTNQSQKKKIKEAFEWLLKVSMQHRPRIFNSLNNQHQPSNGAASKQANWIGLLAERKIQDNWAKKINKV